MADQNVNYDELRVKTSYPVSDEWDYFTELKIVNLDQERVKDLSTGNGFILSSPKAIKNDIKDIDGLFSTRYGQTLQDVNPFINRYKCKCGHLQSRFYKGITCPVCKTPVKFVDDNFSYFGWIVLKDPYHIIHPNLYKSLASLIGVTAFNNIISPVNKKDEDGNEIEFKTPKDEPFYGLGLLDFYDRFDEIIEYYGNKTINNPNKQEYYKNILEEKDNIFIQSIPVFTTHLRPFKLEGGMFNYEGTNSLYNMISKLVSVINNDDLKIFRKKKPKNQLLYDLQTKFNELYKEIINIISGKKGYVRSLFAGRFNFTSRSVIVPDPGLRIDEVKLSYQCLVGLLQQIIINILHRTYSMSYNDAYIFLAVNNTTTENPIIREIIMGIIKNNKRGIPVIINRNPTISYGGILQMYCVGISDGYTMQVPLQILKGMGADFDGDTLNILLVINQNFLSAVENVFNPRNCMYISKNDGKFDNWYNHQKDTLINLNTMINLSRSSYSKEQIEAIRRAREDS